MALAMKVISQVEAQRKILEEAVSTALELASGKSDGAEVAVSKTTGISVSTRYGEVENVEFNSDGALGITVYHQNRKGSASSTDLSPQAIARTVQAALDIARYTSPDPCAGVADKELLAFDAPDLDLFHPAEVSPDEAIELAARAEQAALQADKRITNTEGGSFNSHYGVKVFGNSHGMLQGYCSTRHSLSSCVIAEENGDMERDYAYTIGRAMSDLQTPEWVGADCARRTLSRLSPRKLSTMKAPVIFANEVATGLFGHLVGAIAGGSVYRKSTFLLDSLGKQILPDWLTIEEHPHLLKGLASTPFDSEGVRTERRDIIKDGILTQWLLTSYSARKLGLTRSAMFSCSTSCSRMGTNAVNTNPSLKTGSPPEYSFVYFIRFLTPLPSSSARPICINTSAITGFLGTGVKLFKSISPSKTGRLALRVSIPSFVMVI